MKQTIVYIFLMVITFSIWGCRKNNSGDASILYGKWSKGTSFGDTLFFYQKNGRNILSYQVSFSPAFPASTQTDYSYSNGKLNIRHGRDGLSTIQSFKWKQYGKEFEIQGIELYSFMSSTQVYFTYHKLQ